MWLINTTTIELELFMGELPEYVILSHTWGKEEVSYQAFANPSSAKQLKGYQKIAKTCSLARESGITHAWVDTCCIDKTSSAELTEAINSMFDWYARAKFAYAWLADWDGDDSTLPRCRWFTRGWTLQELIAPAALEFYDAEWTARGSKATLSKALTDITGVDEAVLRDSALLPTVPVARRMSWAAGRTTTRAEDTAYCLLGIFGVNMPLLYGEGARAFIRLQETILAEANDLTLFAWRAESEEGSQRFRGILARNPREFAGVGGRIEPNSAASFSQEFAVTNKGVRIEAGLAHGNSVLPLDCVLVGDDGRARQLGICLVKHGASAFVRAEPWRLAETKENWVLARASTIYVTKDLPAALSDKLAAEDASKGAIRLGKGIMSSMLGQTDIRPEELWDAREKKFLTSGTASFTGLVVLAGKPDASNVLGGAAFWVVFGKEKWDEKPWVSVVSVVGCDPEIMNAYYNLPRLGQLARARSTPSVTLPNLYPSKPTITVAAAIREVESGGSAVHELDITVDAAGKGRVIG